jgi:RNA-directed DNA polymerase
VNVDEMQKKLSQKAGKEPEHQFENLYGLLCNEVWLRVAHHAVNTNQGRETAGIDGETMSHFNGDLEGNLKRLQEQLKARTFEPMPVKRVYIPKPVVLENNNWSLTLLLAEELPLFPSL